MFTAHLIFGDIDGSSKYDFKQRVEIIEKFQCICFKFKPKRLSQHSFFSIDNDSVMIGFGGQEKLNSGHDVLNYVLELFQELAKHNISVSFGVYLMAIENVPFVSQPGFVDDKNKIYMPDAPFLSNGKVIRRLLVGDPLIVADRLLRISKISNKKICFAVNNDGLISGFMPDDFGFSKLSNWEKLINIEYIDFMHDHGIREVFYIK